MFGVLLFRILPVDVEIVVIYMLSLYSRDWFDSCMIAWDGSLLYLVVVTHSGWMVVMTLLFLSSVMEDMSAIELSNQNRDIQVIRRMIDVKLLRQGAPHNRFLPTLHTALVSKTISGIYLKIFHVIFGILVTKAPKS